ncbi:hypothetical protein MTO96_008502 [Rhipicephalus appendiculatus]
MDRRSEIGRARGSSQKQRTRACNAASTRQTKKREIETPTACATVYGVTQCGCVQHTCDPRDSRRIDP